MFTFQEKFQLYDDDYKPYGILIESCSELWHKHSRRVKDGYSIPCAGNRYFLNVPKTRAFESCFSFQFGALGSEAGVSAVFGYELYGHNGFEIRVEWKKEESLATVSLIKICEEHESVVEQKTFENIPFPQENTEYSIEIRATETGVYVNVSTLQMCYFTLETNAGLVGFTRPDFVGDVVFTSAEVHIDCEPQAIGKPLKVEIPTVNGGTMPFTMEYETFLCGEKRYLKATLDGGPQYRENYPYYPRKTGQYGVEKSFMDTPYVIYNGKKFKMFDGEYTTFDPALAWKELLVKALDLSLMPLTVVYPVDGEMETLGFGYENLEVVGFKMQEGKAEFNFSKTGEYFGETVFPDTFTLKSPADKKAVKMIPESVYEYQTVRAHFAKNHYFAEDEEIEFTIVANTNKEYITYEAELQNVYGEMLEKLPVQDGKIQRAPLPVGVYRVLLQVYYGGEIFQTVDTVFEVFDETGKKCAPLESGLPFQFSMPNEQQYLDRDAFDPWNNGYASNAEHYFSCTAFTGDVAERKRTWEVTKKFGREWYVWLSSNRTMEGHDYKEHLDILKNAEYIYYPCDYEWECLRSDCINLGFWKIMPKLRALLDAFLDEREGARALVGLERGAPVTEEAVVNLHKYYKNEWYSLVQQKKKAGFIEQNELFKQYNPNWKRACYGPFNVYASINTSYPSCEMYGFETGDTLSDVIYTGFAQFEDYPASCAYYTYRGAFGVGTTLVNSPRLTIYPEQYTSSRGGCIDGKVYFATPPIGGYVMPLWFNTTHAREYVYNTPVKTADGYRYWDTYGFMKRDFSNDFNESFVRDWKYVLKYKPQRPLKSMVIVSDFTSEDDRCETEYVNNFRAHTVYNISCEAASYLYGISRHAGLPNATFTSFTCLNTLTEKDVDLLVLPSTQGVDEQVLTKIRELHNKGVALFAVSRVDGLEDLFGVRYEPQTAKIYQLQNSKQQENVYPYEVTANYQANGADVLLTASNLPAVFKYGNAALLNIPCASMGRAYFKYDYDNGRESISELLHETCKELLCEFSSPIAQSDGCGITVLKDAKGNTLLLAIDYSRYDQSELTLLREYTVRLEKGRYKDAVAIDGKPLRKLRAKDGTLDGVVIGLRQHESALIKLL